MSVKLRLLVACGALAVAAIVVVGLLQSDSGSSSAPKPLTAAQVAEGVAGAPPALAAVHAQGNDLLGGGDKALKARIRSLRGHPVVVNVWGAWCDPCRAEFPVFQRVAVKHAAKVAFLGVDTVDSADAAKRFLAKVPVPYPSYQDLKGEIANGYGILATPSTIFYDARGRMTPHTGPYHTEADLEADIRRYALGA